MSYLLSPRFSIVVTLGLAGFLAAGADAQEPERPAGTFRERVEVAEVLLDVIAFDRRGEAVPDLGVDDFVVREDGEPVEITGLSFFTTWYDPAGREAIAGPGAVEHRSEIPSSRHFILFFHDPRHQSSQPWGSRLDLLREQWRAGLDARRWLAEDLQPSDWVAVAGYRGELVLYHDFSQDRDALAEAVATAAAAKAPPLLPPSRRPRPPQSGTAALRRMLDRIDDLPRKSERLEDALGLVAEAAAHIVGRKNLIFFTPGIGSARDEDGERLERALNAHNVALYTVDLGGPLGRGHEALVAEGSGGAFFAGLSYRSNLQRIARENRGYYLLSYRTRLAAGENDYRAIEVQARDRKIEVRARRGFELGG